MLCGILFVVYTGIQLPSPPTATSGHPPRRSGRHLGSHRKHTVGLARRRRSDITAVRLAITPETHAYWIGGQQITNDQRSYWLGGGNAALRWRHPHPPVHCLSQANRSRSPRPCIRP